MEWAEVAQLLDSGLAMLGTSAGEGGQPEAFRVWGARACGEHRVRLLVSSDACETMERIGPGAAVALLLTDITTYRSLQLKGRATCGPQAPSAEDMAHYRRYDEQLHAALEQIGHPRRLGASLRPLAIFVIDLDVDQLFNQTPGPGAGRPA